MNKSDTSVENLVINKLSEEQLQSLIDNNGLQPNQLYVTNNDSSLNAGSSGGGSGDTTVKVNGSKVSVLNFTSDPQTQINSLANSIPTQIEEATSDKISSNVENLNMWVGTTAEYDAIPTKDANTIYVKKDETMINDIAVSTESTWSSYKISTMSSGQSNFTFVVSSNADLSKWATNAAGNDYTSVYISQGTWTLASGSINLTTTGTKIVEGHPNSKIVFSNANQAIGGNYYPGMFYTSGHAGNKDYLINNVNVEVHGAASDSSTNRYAVGFAYCANLTNCFATAISTGTKNWQAAYAFYNCDSLMNCNGRSSGANNGNAYVYAYCNYLTGCRADQGNFASTYDAQADVYCYVSCSNCSSCYFQATNGFELLRGFFKSNNLSACGGSVTQNTGGDSLTNMTCYEECYRLTSCEGSNSRGVGREPTKSGDNVFYRCSGVTNCKTSGGGMKNCNLCLGNNATAYTNCWANGGNSVAVADTAAGGFNGINIGYPGN